MNEEWRPVVGFESQYEVSDAGRIRSLPREGTYLRILKQRVVRSGYNVISVWPHRNLYVHRLVLLAFVGPCPAGHEAAHLNGTKGDNRPGNLAWVSHATNECHKRAHGSNLIGERNGSAKLTDAQAREILSLRGTAPSRAIGKRFGIARTHVQAIWRGERWAHLQANAQEAGR